MGREGNRMTRVLALAAVERRLSRDWHSLSKDRLEGTRLEGTRLEGTRLEDWYPVPKEY